MNQADIDWYANRIKAGIAEAACRCHFEALGYTVEAYSVEHVAPHFAALTTGRDPLGNYAKTLKTLRSTPDFLISRHHPDTELNRNKHSVGKVEALLVEAKFRTEVVFEDIENEFFGRYQSQIEAGQNILIYLVVPHTGRKQKGAPRVHLCFYSKSLYGNAPNKTNGFVSAGNSLLSALPLYQGNRDGEDFNTIYQTIVGPVLSEIFKGRNG